MYVHDLPTVFDPFAKPQTKIEEGFQELQKSIWVGVGMSLGLSIGAFLYWVVFSKD